MCVCVCVCVCVHTHRVRQKNLTVLNITGLKKRQVFLPHSVYIYIYIQVSQEKSTKLREGVPYVKLYRYNPKHLYPKLNGYGDNGKRSLKL